MIFCVEDDDGIRELIIYTLTASSFEAEGFSEPDSFWEAVRRKTPELIILDIMLPREDGLSILKKLRKKSETSHIPIIMATAKGTEYDKVVGLDSGADDYLVKPFGMMEMVSRVKALLRRTSKNRETLLYRQELVLNTVEHTVTVDENEVKVTLKEYELLKLFMENPGRVFTREQLLTAVWGMDYVGETRTVDVHIGTLRTKLGMSGNAIKTVRGVGYRMEGVK